MLEIFDKNKKNAHFRLKMLDFLLKYLLFIKKCVILQAICIPIIVSVPDVFGK